MILNQRSLILLCCIIIDMPATVVVNGNGHGPLPNGHAAQETKPSAAKSRGALKRLKAKAKIARGASESASEAGTESDVEVGPRVVHWSYSAGRLGPTNRQREKQDLTLRPVHRIHRLNSLHLSRYSLLPPRRLRSRIFGLCLCFRPLPGRRSGTGQGGGLLFRRGGRG